MSLPLSISYILDKRDRAIDLAGSRKEQVHSLLEHSKIPPMALKPLPYFKWPAPRCPEPESTGFYTAISLRESDSWTSRSQSPLPPLAEMLPICRLFPHDALQRCLQPSGDPFNGAPLGIRKYPCVLNKGPEQEKKEQYQQLPCSLPISTEVQSCKPNYNERRPMLKDHESDTGLHREPQTQQIVPRSDACAPRRCQPVSTSPFEDTIIDHRPQVELIDHEEDNATHQSPNPQPRNELADHQSHAALYNGPHREPADPRRGFRVHQDRPLRIQVEVMDDGSWHHGPYHEQSGSPGDTTSQPYHPSGIPPPLTVPYAGMPRPTDYLPMPLPPCASSTAFALKPRVEGSHVGQHSFEETGSSETEPPIAAMAFSLEEEEQRRIIIRQDHVYVQCRSGKFLKVNNVALEAVKNGAIAKRRLGTRRPRNRGSRSSGSRAPKRSEQTMRRRYRQRSIPSSQEETTLRGESSRRASAPEPECCLAANGTRSCSHHCESQSSSSVAEKGG